MAAAREELEADRIEEEMKRVGDRSKRPAKQIGTAARDLIKELKVGYRRIRSQIDDTGN